MSQFTVVDVSSEGEGQSEGPTSQHGQGRRSLASAGIAVGSIVAMGALLVLHFSSPAAAPVPSQPVTVRSLLEGDELVDVATRNIMAHGGDTDRSLVRARVASSVSLITADIMEREPAAHEKMGTLTVSPHQKESAFRVLEKHGDSRMVGITRKVLAAVRETAQDGGDKSVLARKLIASLTSNFGDLAQLRKEMHLDAEDAAELKELTGELDADVARRLSSKDGDVRSQVRTLLHGLEHELGEEMPKAPARMLQSYGTTTSVGGAPTGSGDTSFMTCVMKAVPNPTEVVSCITDNMSEVFSMVKKAMR